MAARPLLIIDDDAAIAAVIVSALEDDGYAVAAATSSQEARRLLEAHGPEGFALVMSDSFTTSSAEAFTWLAEVRTLTRAPVVISSAHPASAFPGWPERGFDGMLPKPFDLDDLAAVVVGLCGRPEPER